MSLCMKKTIYKKLKFLPIFLLSLVLPTHFAYAGIFPDWDDIWDTVAEFFAEDIWQYLIGAILMVINLFMGFLAWGTKAVLKLAIYIMDESIDHFIFGMKKWVDLGVVDAGWDVMSNVANMVFIFALLYIGIATILGFNYRKQLIPIIIAAMLVNFSLVFTKAAVDMSNVFAISFYKTAETEAGARTPVEHIEHHMDIDTRIVNLAASTTQYDTATIDGQVSSGAMDTSDAVLYYAWNDLLVSMLKVPFYLLAAYIFFQFAVLLISRFIIIVFLLILSPVAFASYPVPQMKSKIFSRWAEALSSQLLLAPVLMFFFYITVVLAGKVFTGPGSGSTFLGFMVLMGFLIFSLEAAKEISSGVGSQVHNYFQTKATGVSQFTARHTAGRAGRTAAGSTFATKMAASDSRAAQLAGRNMLRLGNYMNESKWGGKTSFKDSVDASAKRKTAMNTQIHDNFEAAAGRAKKKYEGLDTSKKDLIKKKLGLQSLNEKEEKEAGKYVRPAKTSFTVSPEGKLMAKEEKMHLTNKGKKALGINLKKKEEALEAQRKSYLDRMGAEAKKASVFSDAPIFNQTEKAKGDAFGAITKKKTIEAEQKARDKKRGEQFTIATEKLGAAIESNNMNKVVEEMKKLTKSSVRHIPEKHLTHPSVAASLSKQQLSGVLEHHTEDIIQKVKTQIKITAQNPNHTLNKNAKSLLDHINHNNGPMNQA